MAKVSLGSSAFNGTNGKHFTLELQYELTQNVSANTSTIKYYLYVKTSQYGSGYGSRVPGYINGVDVGGVTSLNVNSTVLVGTKEETKQHNPDGTLTVGYSASMGGVWSGLGYANIGGNLTLPTIPRATKIGEHTGTIGQSLTINWTKATSSFSHTLTYSLGSIENEVLGEDLVDGFVWNIPDKLYKEFVDKPSEVGTLKLTTYNGNTQIGSTQEAKLTITADESQSNSVIEEFSVRDENGTTKALTGDNSVLVLTKSTAFVSLVFSTRKYATVKSVTVNGQQLSVSAGTTDDKGNTSYGVMTDIGVANTGTFTVTIVDSRGFSITKTTRNDIIDYVPLDVVVSFKRIAPTTGEVGLEFNGNYFNGSFGQESNNLEISYKYKKSNETTYSNEFTLMKDTDYKISGNTFYSGNGSSKTQIKLAPNFDYKSQYDMQLIIKDKLTSLPVINVIITKGIPIMWWNGEKVVVNGDLYIADENGNNAVNIKDIAGGIKIVRWESE